MRRIRALLMATVLAIGLTTVGMGSAVAAGPSVWEYGASGDTCTGYFTVGSGDCIYSESNSTFRLDSGDGSSRLEFKPSGGGNAIGWWNPGSTSYWFTSHTTSGAATYTMRLQQDCNVVIYGDTGTGNPKWASGTNINYWDKEDCRLRMFAGYAQVQYASKVDHVWISLCTIPEGHDGNICPGTQGNR